MIKNLPALQENQVQSLGQEDPLEKGMTIHSVFLLGEFSWTEDPGGLLPMGFQKVRCKTGQEATVRTRHGTTDWFQIGKGLRQGCILLPYLFNLHAEYIMQNAILDESQAGIQISGRNINNLRYADDTTLMAENEEELNSLLMKMKEECEKAGLKLNIQDMKIMASSPIISWQINGETMETVTDFIFLGSKITVDGDCSHEIKICLLLGRKATLNLESILKSRNTSLC